MFEGLLSPWHLVIIAFVVFMIFGPKRIADRTKQAGKKISQLAGGEVTPTNPDERVVSTTGFYRLARFFRRRT